MKLLTLLCVLGVLQALYACASSGSATGPSAASSPPQTTDDGLQLKTHTANRVVYVKPGATFGKYNSVKLLDLYVQFQKDWQRNYNSNTPDLSNQVTDQKMAQMKQALATEFKRIFTQELQKGGYQVVTNPGPDVLLLRPAIINLEVTAPDVMSAGMNANFVSSAGSGTLYLELWDSATNTLLARVMDAEADQQPFARQANAVTNTQAADIIITGWADDLVRHLDAVKGKTGQ
jgi:hypothetical protein